MEVKKLEFTERNVNLLDEMNNVLDKLLNVSLKITFSDANTDGDKKIKEIANIVLEHCNRIREERQEIILQ